MIEIPLQNLTYAYDITIPLDGTVYILRFDYNTVEDYWYLSILDADEVYLISSIKLVPNYSLLDDYVVANMPTGNLYLYDPEDDTGATQPTYENIYDRFILIYDSVSS